MLKKLLKKTFYFLLLLSITITIPSKVTADDFLPVNFKNLTGTWSLFYGNNYGYNFKFYKNYRAIVILYLNNSSIIFKGIYNVESSDTIIINVSEMKREEKITDINFKTGFNKAKSSQFIFNTRIIYNTDRKKNLELRPLKILIDGTESEGFFEPYIKLDYSGK
jgi:hypothetical protein